MIWREEEKVLGLMETLFEYFRKHPDELPREFLAVSLRDGLEKAICDYIAGMTDQYAVDKFSSIFIPAAWHIRG